MTRSVTYADFAKLARRRGWTAAWLAEHFKGRIEQPREFFERVLKAGSGSEDRGATLIPYRSVLELYRKEMGPGAANSGARSCDCGCGKPVTGRKRLASGACRKRMERRRSRNPESGSEKHKKDGVFSVTF